jgi:hypothetical protein
MTTEEMNLWFAGVQAFAAIASAAAAVAMWKATVNLVSATRGLTLAAVDPSVRVDVPIKPIPKSDQALATITNSSAFPIVDITVWLDASYSIKAEPASSIGQVLDSIQIAEIPPLGTASVNLWESAKKAIAALNEVPNADKNVGLDLYIEYRHGITGKLDHFTEFYGVAFFPTGELQIKRTGTERPGPRDRLILKRTDSK